jgi:hypothetical protein
MYRFILFHCRHSSLCGFGAELVFVTFYLAYQGWAQQVFFIQSSAAFMCLDTLFVVMPLFCYLIVSDY